MSFTIDDLLESLQDPDRGLSGTLSDIWRRIVNKDKFDELDMNDYEKDKMLNEWIEQNPYSNI
jgi:hypothetical protein